MGFVLSERGFYIGNLYPPAKQRFSKTLYFELGGRFEVDRFPAAEVVSIGLLEQRVLHVVLFVEPGFVPDIGVRFGWYKCRSDIETLQELVVFL